MNTTTSLLDVQPLKDPLLTYRDALGSVRGFTVNLGLALTVAAVAAGYFSFSAAFFIGVCGATAILGLIPTLCILRMLIPKRPVDGIYLRSFRRDDATLQARRAIQDELGEGLRLAGVGRPRRRRSVRELFRLLVCPLQCTTPKYMDLVAGPNWRARLCRTISDVRFVIVDVRDMRPDAASDLAMTLQHTESSRIVLLADTSMTEGEWRDHLSHQLESNYDFSHLRLFVVDGIDNKSLASLADYVRGIPDKASERRDGVVTIEPDDDVLPDEALPTRDSAWLVMSAAFTLLLGGAHTLLILQLPSSILVAPFIALTFVVWWCLISCFWDATTWQRVRVSRIVGTLMVWHLFAYLVVGLVIGLVFEEREYVLQGRSELNLKRIGLAWVNWLSLHPPLDQASTPSWETELLPFLGYDLVYRGMDQSQPWDSPTNQDVVSVRVSEYLSPGVAPEVDDQGRALSHYAGNALVFGANRRIRIADFADGLSNTFIAGEIESLFRPWADPENVRHPSVGVKRGPQSFGRATAASAIMVFADGHVQTVSADVGLPVFEAWGTPNGGEKSTTTH